MGAIDTKWLVVSTSVSELGEWYCETRKEAYGMKRELLKNGCETEDISLYYARRGKIFRSEAADGK